MQRFTIFVAVIINAFTIQVHADEAAVIEKIKKRGGTVEFDRTQLAEPVISISLPGGNVTDADLKELKVFTSLKSLSFRAIVTKSPPRANGRITDAGLKELKDLKNLQFLDLAGQVQITDSGLKELKAFDQLESLVLIHNNITDAGLKELVELTNLRRLTIKFTKVTVAGLSDLKNLKSLKTLVLGNNSVKFNYYAEVKAALPDVEILEESYGR